MKISSELNIGSNQIEVNIDSNKSSNLVKWKVNTVLRTLAFIVDLFYYFNPHCERVASTGSLLHRAGIGACN